MNVNQAFNHHSRVAQANIQPIRPSLTQSTHDIHSSRSRNVSTGTATQSNNTSNADRYISAVRDRVTQANPNAAHRFDRDLSKLLSQHKGSIDSIDDAAKTTAVDQVLTRLTARGDISQELCTELKALNPAASKVGNAPSSGQSTTGTSVDPTQAGGAVMPSSDTATDFASNGEVSKSNGEMKTAQPAAPHAGGIGGNGAASGPEMPNPTFLWKPSSDSDGNLVILLPAGMTGQVAELEVMSPDGKTVLAKGKYTGAGNGMREHYRFGKPGSSFPPGSIVKVTMTNGAQKEIKIPNPGSRMESK